MLFLTAVNAISHYNEKLGMQLKQLDRQDAGISHTRLGTMRKKKSDVNDNGSFQG